MLPSVLIGLHALAWPLVERRLRVDKQRAAERFEELHGTGLASSDPAKLAEAAHHGRIDTLLLSTSPPVGGGPRPSHRRFSSSAPTTPSPTANSSIESPSTP